jgi:hypothetical protein
VLAVMLTGALALVGGVSLDATGMVAVVLAAVVAACLGAGIARESRSVPSPAATVEAAWRSAVGTVAVLLVLGGSAVLAGGAAPVVLAVWAAAVAFGWWLRREDRRRRGPGRDPVGTTGAGRPAARNPVRPASPRSWHPSVRAPGPHPPPPHATGAPAPVPAPDLAQLSTEALGEEWLRSSAALESARDPAARQLVVARRVAALDELERRDPAGFARWLAAGATVHSNPAQYLRGDSSAGSGPV